MGHLETHSNRIWIKYKNSHPENDFENAGYKMVYIFPRWFMLHHVFAAMQWQGNDQELW